MNKNHFAFLLLITLAISIRVWQLDKIPIELFGDELDVGLQAFSLLKTGKDYFGNFLPLMPQSFTEFRLPALIYSAVPFVAIFGLTDLAIRYTAILWGMLALVGFYLLSRQLINSKFALISLVLLALSPWHFFFSRTANDANTVLAVIIWAIWAFLKGLENYKYLALSAILFGLAFYTYSIATLFVPIFGLALIACNFKKIFILPKAKLGLLAILTFLIVLPYLNLYFQGNASRRFSGISILNDKSISDANYKKRAEVNHPLSRVFYNQKAGLLNVYILNYLKSFSTDFLFLVGDPNLRHSVASHGQLYLFETLTILLGFIYLFRNHKTNPNLIIIVLLLLIAPIPAAATVGGGNHAARLILLLPPLTLLSSLGIYFLVINLRSHFAKLALGAIALIAVFNISFYFYHYFLAWPKESFRFWQYGYQEAMGSIKEDDAKYQRVFFNSTYEPALPRFLFYYQYDPATFHQQFKGIESTENITQGFNGFKLGDRYHFGIVAKLIKDEGFAELLGEKDVYLVSVRDEVGTDDWISNPPKNLNILKTINDPTGKPIFFIVTKKPRLPSP